MTRPWMGNPAVVVVFIGAMLAASSSAFAQQASLSEPVAAINVGTSCCGLCGNLACASCSVFDVRLTGGACTESYVVFAADASAGAGAGAIAGLVLGVIPAIALTAVIVSTSATEVPFRDAAYGFLGMLGCSLLIGACGGGVLGSLVGMVHALLVLGARVTEASPPPRGRRPPRRRGRYTLSPNAPATAAIAPMMF